MFTKLFFIICVFSKWQKDIACYFCNVITFRDGGRSENLGWRVVMRRAGAAATAAVFVSAKIWGGEAPTPLSPSLTLLGLIFLPFRIDLIKPNESNQQNWVDFFILPSGFLCRFSALPFSITDSKFHSNLTLALCFSVK